MPDHHRTNVLRITAVLLLATLTLYVGSYAALVERHTGTIWMVGPAKEFVSPSYKAHYRLLKTLFAPLEWLDTNYIRRDYWKTK